MEERFLRTAYVIGDEAVMRLRDSRVILFGVGGVGSFCAEALARAGVCTITLVDPDRVAESNINRQLVALHSTIGQNKAEVMKARIADINPEADVTAIDLFYLPENADEIDLSSYDMILDAIDTVSAKIELAVRAGALGIPMISAMGTGNKLHPEKLVITDIAKTKMCPLARVMRRELKARGIDHLTVVYSEEEPISRHKDHMDAPDMQAGAKRTPGSVSFVPSAAGLLMASEAVRILMEKQEM